MKVSFWFIISSVIFLAYFCESALSPEVKKVYTGFLSGKGLYNDDDGIVILNSTNFKSSIYEKSNAWLVEFYNSWCGHCHKFAPVWKSLAASLYEWRKVIQLAAIDCADDENTSICRSYDILGYPTVKFFSAYSLPSSLGTELEVIKSSHSESDIIRDIIGILQKEQLEGRGNHWPNIIPYRNYDTKNLWRPSDSTHYIFLIFANENDPLAPEVTLDLSNVENIEVRGVVSDNEVISKLLGVRSYPSLLVWEKSKEWPEFLRPEEANRESYRLAIKSFLKNKGFAIPDEPKTVKKLSSNELPSLIELQNARDALIRLQKIKELGDVVFLVDLENTVRYSLEHEISARKNISEEGFVALRKYLEVLIKYFPMSESGIIFMQKLKESVLNEVEIRGQNFKKYLSKAGGLDLAFSTKHDWIGCKGSESHFRGYPCGMWTVFHYLTVNALRDSNRKHFNPLEVLEAMLGYITYFFGCTQCSKHFQEMAINRSMKSKVKNGDEAVLWLWSAHNEVNKRLAKDESEDPEFPKIQFPSADRCPNCKDADGNWDEQSVLKYLKIVYGQDNLNVLGSSTTIRFPREPNTDDNNSLSNSKLFEDDSPKKIGKDFNVFDISLCVVLYVISAVICVGVCLKFILKRRHRRKSYGQDLLGKV